MPHVRGYVPAPQRIRDVWVGGSTNRLRDFTFGHRVTCAALSFKVDTLALHRPDPAPTVCASGGVPPDWVPTERHLATRKGKSAVGYKTEKYLAVALRDQGLPDDFLSEAPFTVAGKIHAVGNGVPLAMGRAVAAAVLRAIRNSSEEG